jgi:NADPH:quinone reductase-like Zn-dependent oxidoreductase
MKAWTIGETAGPGGLRAMACPEPIPGAGDVLLRVVAVSLNYRDLLVTQGAYHKGRPPAGGVPCSDAAGEVIAVGSDVTGVGPGDRVMSLFAPDWQQGTLTRAALRTTLGSGHGPGMLSEYVALPARAVVPVPSRFSAVQGATLPCAALTAWHALFEEVTVGAGSTVLTLGGGGVSVFALQMAHAAGARVIAASSSEQRLDRLRALGAWAGVNYRERRSWGEHVRELAGGEGVDMVIEVGGGGTIGESCRAVRPGGMIALIGTLAEPAPVHLTPILLRNIRVQGTTVGSREMCERMVAALSDWTLEPVIDSVFSLDEAPAAFDRLASGRQFGKIVIQIREA